MHVRGGGGGSATRASGASTSSSWARYVPGFVLGFLGMALVRSVGDAMVGRWGAAYGVFDAPGWAAFTAFVGDTLASRVLLGTAMAAVGLSTSVAVFKGMGLKPFAVGFAGALAVGAVGMLMAVLFGGFVTL